MSALKGTFLSRDVRKVIFGNKKEAFYHKMACLGAVSVKRKASYHSADQKNENVNLSVSFYIV